MKNKIKILSLLLAACCILNVPVHATTYASDQLSAWGLTLRAKENGKILIGFSVQGTDVMRSLGASQIKVYEKITMPSGTQTWLLVASFSETDAGMTASDKYSFSSQQSFGGTPGVQYRVDATVFATDYDGVRDSRTLTKYITASVTGS